MASLVMLSISATGFASLPNTPVIPFHKMTEGKGGTLWFV